MRQLKCENCGGKLEVQESSVLADEEGSIFILRKGTKLHCPFCDADYSQGDELEEFPTGDIATGNAVIDKRRGKIFISGTVQGDVVGGNQSKG